MCTLKSFDVVMPPCAQKAVLHHETFFQIALYLNMPIISLLVSDSRTLKQYQLTRSCSAGFPLASASHSICRDVPFSKSYKIKIKSNTFCFQERKKSGTVTNKAKQN